MPTEPPVDIVDHTPLSCPPLRTRNATWSFVPGASVTPTRSTFTHAARASMPMAPLTGLVWILRFSTTTSGASIVTAALPVETIFAPLSGPTMSTGLAAVIVQAPVYGPAPSMITSLPGLVAAAVRAASIDAFGVPSHATPTQYVVAAWAEGVTSSTVRSAASRSLGSMHRPCRARGPAATGAPPSVSPN
jgi:hypothetical protein